MADLIEHFERVLGPIQEGWNVDADGEKMPFQIVRFKRGSGPGTISFATLGLGRHGLPSSTSSQLIRHELLVMVPETLQRGPIPSILQQVATDAHNSQRALLRGEVLGPQGPLLPGSSMEALYVGAPVYFPDEFSSCDTEGHTVVIAWLIPISKIEAEYVFENGWPSFEERLVEHNPDLTDVFRSSMSL